MSETDSLWAHCTDETLVGQLKRTDSLSIGDTRLRRQRPGDRRWGNGGNGGMRPTLGKAGPGGSGGFSGRSPDEVCCAMSQHDDRRVRAAARDHRQHGTVDHPEVFDAMDSALRIDNGQRVAG
jgi:hypothetical protein